jgi:hypothetical protein
LELNGAANQQSQVKKMKIKIGRLFLMPGLGLLAAMVVIGINGCTSGPLSSNLSHSPTDDNSTFSGDNHIQPVYTSPTVAPATTNLPAGNLPNN